MQRLALILASATMCACAKPAANCHPSTLEKRAEFVLACAETSLFNTPSSCRETAEKIYCPPKQDD